MYIKADREAHGNNMSLICLLLLSDQPRKIRIICANYKVSLKIAANVFETASVHWVPAVKTGYNVLLKVDTPFQEPVTGMIL